ncbi:MAG: hypothetical protein ACTS3F_09845 [Phycisphaerales bacterium]
MNNADLMGSQAPPSDAGHESPALSQHDLARARSPYTRRERILRILWNYLGQTLFSLTFHNWYALRAAMLRLFGAKIGHPVRLRPTVRIEQPWNLTMGDNSSAGDHAILYCLGKVNIGRNVSISQYAHLCAGSHDYRYRNLPLTRPPIHIEDDAWIAADAFVGPGVTVREGTIIGARATVLRSTNPWTIYLGNPAQPVKDRPHPIDESAPAARAPAPSQRPESDQQRGASAV